MKSVRSKSKKPNLEHWLKNKLRRASYMWPPRKEAIVNARVERGKYKCNSCENIFGPKEIQLDHINPVINEEEGFVDWNTYIERLFCSTELFQVLCKPCHEMKTFFENEIRTQARQDKRKEKAKDEEEI